MIDITIATDNDIPELAELLGILFSQEEEFQPGIEAQKKGLEMIIRNPDTGFILKGTINSLTVGMVTILYTVSTAIGQRAALLEDMIVLPGYRGNGIGSSLLTRAVSEAGINGCGRITLLTDRSNKEAQRFYQRHGFESSPMVPYRLHLPTQKQTGRTVF